MNFFIPILILFIIITTQFIFTLPVFPGAIGFGTDTPAGSGRHLSIPQTTVYKVTNLATSGEGSLKECVDGIGPRTCIFEVSGTIVLNDKMRIDNPYLTIVGETAPSPGIMIRGGYLIINAEHVLIRHIFIRMGDEPEVNVDCDNRDVLDIMADNVVVDHCSFAFGIDETVTWYLAPQKTTLSYCFVSYSLHESCHSKGNHGKGSIVSTYSEKTTIHHCLYAHHNDRCPRMGGATKVEVVNNLIYNCAATDLGQSNDGPVIMNVHVIGNHYIQGPISSDDIKITNNADPTYNMPTESKFYIDDNLGDLRPTGSEDDWENVKDKTGNGKATFRSNNLVFTTSGIVPSVASDTLQEVLTNSGARPTERDLYDQRLVDEIKNNEGDYINCVRDHSPKCNGQRNAGGWVTFEENTRTLTVPANHNEVESNGYTKLENWIFTFSEKFVNKTDDDDDDDKRNRIIITTAISSGSVLAVILLIGIVVSIIVCVKLKKKTNFKKLIEVKSDQEIMASKDEVVKSGVDEDFTSKM